MYRDLFINQGADFTANLDLKHQDNSPVNVAGFVFAGALSKSYYTANLTANLVLTVANATRGNVVVSLNAATTANITGGTYVYDVKMTDTSNTVSRVMEGVIVMSPRVTR